MMKNVRNIASPTSTWFGGTCWVPSAWRRNASTITIRVNEVTITNSAGASDRTVSSRTICTARPADDAEPACPTWIEIAGRPAPEEVAASAGITKVNAMNKNMRATRRGNPPWLPSPGR